MYFLTREYKLFALIKINHPRPNQNIINILGREKNYPEANVLLCTKLRWFSKA